jgi:hypothetical protein
MKTILQILLTVVCGAGIFFGYLFHNKFQDQFNQTVNLITENTSLTKDIAKAKEELKVETEGLKIAKNDFDQKNLKFDSLASTEKQAKREISEGDAKLAEQAEEITQQEKLVAEVKSIVEQQGGAGVTIDNIGEKITEIDESKKAKTQELDELVTLVNGAETVVTTNKLTFAELASRKAKRDTSINSNAKEAVITSVNADWGFVVIGAGSNSGFTPQTPLLIKRDGKLIGRIKPTSIEPAQTIADIDLASIAPGASIQAGDRVLLAIPRKN